MSRAERFRELPAVDRLMAHPDLNKELAEHGPARLADLARAAVAELRERLAADELAADRDGLISLALAGVRRRLETARRKRLTRVVNATGVVLHTNLGRAPLADEALQAIADVGRYGNVELDLETGDRSRRGGQLDELWRELTGAEASLVVNNCAAATLLTLQTLASGKEALVSRGQLIEIGGSYRLPDVFRQSGALLREVGTTNRTRLADYESAILPGTTAALLRVHPSNFRVVGFVEEVSISELVQLAERRDLFALDDVGSGALVDLAPYGLPDEPTVASSLSAGADAVIFSGDKLLGGPQCGVILGKRAVIERLRSSPLTRALRVDKLTLAALQATLEIYRRGEALTKIPVLRQLTTPAEEIRRRAEALCSRLPSAARASVSASTSAVGGGSLPLRELPTFVVRLAPHGLSAETVATRLRIGVVPVVARIEASSVLLDLRTVAPGSEETDLERMIAVAVAAA